MLKVKKMVVNNKNYNNTFVDNNDNIEKKNNNEKNNDDEKNTTLDNSCDINLEDEYNSLNCNENNLSRDCVIAAAEFKQYTFIASNCLVNAQP
jgi:hypothetical protein